MASQVFLAAAFFVCFFGHGLASTLSYENPTKVTFQNKNKRTELLIDLEAYTQEGLMISVSKLQGLDFFAFNGKINLPIRVREQGNITWEVLRPSADVETKFFPDKQLLSGDVINFWLRIQKNGVSIHSDVYSYIIKEVKPLPPSMAVDERPSLQESATINQRPLITGGATLTTTRRPPIQQSPPLSVPECACNEETLNDLWAKLNNTKQQMQLLEESINPLKNKLSSLTEAFDELVKTSDVGTELLLTGTLPVRSNPVEDVRHLLIEKLNLRDLSSSILQAEYTSDGIKFEMATSIDKLRVLKRANDILAKLPYQIIDLKGRPLIDVRSD